MLDRRQDLELAEAEVPCMYGPVGGAGSAEDVGDLDRGAHGSAVGRDLCLLEQPELVERARDGAHRPGRDLGVEGGVVELRMSEQDLDDADVGAVPQQVGGEAVAQGVRPDPFGDVWRPAPPRGRCDGAAAC